TPCSAPRAPLAWSRSAWGSSWRGVIAPTFVRCSSPRPSRAGRGERVSHPRVDSPWRRGAGRETLDAEARTMSRSAFGRFLFCASMTCAWGYVAIPDAAACGGTFCDAGPQVMPVDQRGENILFVVDGDTVEAHVQIEYTGDPEKFAWIVP